MGLTRRPVVSVVYGIGCLLIIFGGFGISGTRTDVNCLKRIRESIKDPNGYLDETWDFSNKTEGGICRFIGIECWNPEENRVLNIKLTNMGLVGQFPLGVQDCKSLTGLDLSGNKFTGPIPSNIYTIIPFVTTLDLSANNFSGEIPDMLANCTYLSDIRLDHNQLSGQIPLQLGFLRRVKSFNVANNKLSGSVPVFDVAIPIVNYANNPGLCGPPLHPCSVSSNGIKSWYIAGVVVVVAIVVVLGVIACVYILKDF